MAKKPEHKILYYVSRPDENGDVQILRTVAKITAKQIKTTDDIPYGHFQRGRWRSSTRIWGLNAIDNKGSLFSTPRLALDNYHKLAREHISNLELEVAHLKAGAIIVNALLEQEEEVLNEALENIWEQNSE